MKVRPTELDVRNPFKRDRTIEEEQQIRPGSTHSSIGVVKFKENRISLP
jgi:hypothetical protein